MMSLQNRVNNIEENEVRAITMAPGLFMSKEDDDKDSKPKGFEKFFKKKSDKETS
jgi:hypothetical protein